MSESPGISQASRFRREVLLAEWYSRTSSVKIRAQCTLCLAHRCLYVPQRPFVDFLSKVIQGGIGPAEDLDSVGPKV